MFTTHVAVPGRRVSIRTVANSLIRHRIRPTVSIMDCQCHVVYVQQSVSLSTGKIQQNKQFTALTTVKFISILMTKFSRKWIWNSRFQCLYLN